MPSRFLVTSSSLAGSTDENKGDAVIWEADGQIAASAVVALQGIQPSFLDLNGHKTAFANLLLSKTAIIRTGKDGTLRVKQLFVEGKRLADGTYRAPQPWLEGTGTVTVDARVDVRGTIGSPEAAIGAGNMGNLTGNAKIGYPSGGGDYDIATNGFHAFSSIAATATRSRTPAASPERATSSSSWGRRTRAFATPRWC